MSSCNPVSCSRRTLHHGVRNYITWLNEQIYLTTPYIAQLHHVNNKLRKLNIELIPAAARLLGLWVRIPPAAWISVSCKCRVLSDIETRSIHSQSVTGQFLEPVQISSHSTHFFLKILNTVFPFTPLVPKGCPFHHVFPTRMLYAFLISSVPDSCPVHF